MLRRYPPFGLHPAPAPWGPLIPLLSGNANCVGSIPDEAESKADEEHKRPVRISRLHVQFTEAKLTQDPGERSTPLRKFAYDAKPLGVIYTGSAPHFLTNWKVSPGARLGRRRVGVRSFFAIVCHRSRPCVKWARPVVYEQVPSPA